MNMELINAEQARIEAERAQIMELAALNRKKFDAAMAAAKEANACGDFKSYEAHMRECDKLLQQSRLLNKMLEHTAESARRLLVTMLGPLGGMIFDSLVNSDENDEEEGS